MFHKKGQRNTISNGQILHKRLLTTMVRLGKHSSAKRALLAVLFAPGRDVGPIVRVKLLSGAANCQAMGIKSNKQLGKNPRKTHKNACFEPSYPFSIISNT